MACARSSDHAVYYDVSNIKGYSFVAARIKMTSSNGSVDVACFKGGRCRQKAYNTPKDDRFSNLLLESYHSDGGRCTVRELTMAPSWLELNEG